MIIHEQNNQIHKNAVIGGKAKHLLGLTLNGFNVPSWCVIPEDFFKDLLKTSGVDYRSLSTSELKEAINGIQLNAELLQSIKKQLNLTDLSFVAVRSSANDEDGSEASFAGQYDSHLFVSPNDILENVKKVWLSAFSEHILSYRKENGLEPNPFVAVIIQVMVDADVAGVAFGANPVNGNRKEKVISALYGLGEGLVSGELNADNFILSPSGIKTELANKERTFKYINNKLAYYPVDSVKANNACLSNAQVKEVGEVLNKIKKVFKHYQDIEFAYYNNELFLLQARPITSLTQLPDVSSNHQLWDNSNIIESYPGISSPLTFSFISKMYESVYIQFCDLMGVDKNKINDNKAVFENTLGLINGKVYYNLINWYKMLSLLPGYALNKKYMEQMMGVKESISDDVAIPNNDSKFKSYRKLGGVIWKVGGEFRKIKKNRAKFLKSTEAVFTKYRKIDWNELSAHEIMEHYQQYERVLLEQWRAPLINDFFAMIFFGILKKQTEQLAPDNPNLANDLLIGSNDIISVEPVIRIQKIRELVQKNPACYKLFKENEALIVYRDLVNYPEVYNEVQDYLTVFGDRCTGELKLETKTYTTEPLDFISLIIDQIDVTVDVDKLHENGLKLRNEAEEIVFAKLKGFKKQKFNYVLKKTRELVSQRENLRFERTKAFGFVRVMFNALGDQFFAEAVIDQPEDIFYLKQTEVFEYIRGTSVNNNLANLIALRKSEYATFDKYDADDRFPTNGITYLGNDYRNTTDIESDSNADLKGIGCSPGIVEMEVKIVNSPKEVKNLKGKIMVCESTDPGWVTLFPTCSAIIVERGSLLSHSAIVSREMGVPCIVGVSNVLQKLKDGDKVRMNGSTGAIDII